jgi:His-Xaa-Ser system radical SAM maturase HxsC
MCPYSDNYRKRAIPADSQHVLNMIDHILFNPEYITLTGGEPTTIGEGVFDIIYALKDKFPYTEYQFLTNGRVFSDNEYFDRFMTVTPECICFGIPIYGDDPASHDYITRANGSFVEAVRGIQNLMNADMKVELRIVVSKLNYQNLNNIAKFICRYLHKAFVVNFVGLEMCGNAAKNRTDVWIDYSEAVLHSRSAIDILYSKGIDVGIYNFPLCAVDEKYRYLCKRSINSYKIVYDEKCNECQLRDICGGFFKTTYLLERPKVEPIVV